MTLVSHVLSLLLQTLGIQELSVIVYFLLWGKKAWVTAPFPVLVHCGCHIRSPCSFSRITITSLGILSYTTGLSSTPASFASLSTNSFPSIPACPFTQPKCLLYFKCISVIILFLMDSINLFRLNMFCNKSKVILLSVYIAMCSSLSCPASSSSNFSKTFKIAI